MIITIDGPAGSGKSTAARKLAQVLGISYLDSGATYRAVTLRALRGGVDMQDADALVAQARQIDLKMIPNPEGVCVEMDGSDVSKDIRTEEVSTNAHYVANCPAVREVLVDLQRKTGLELGDFVTEGREQGTVVFPNADFKFYLDATPTVRAKRRQAELIQRGEQADYQEILTAIVKRDHSDSSRSVGPLKVPDDAMIIDTTDKTIDETLEQLRRYVEKAR